MTNKSFWTVTLLSSFLLCIGFSCVAEIESQSAFTSDMLLQNAIKAGQLDDVRTLLQNGIDVNKPFNDGITPLHVSVINNQENIAAVLIQAGAKIDEPDSTTHATPLHMAALYGRVGIAELLIKKGANVNALMKFEITPLLVAAQFKHPQIVEILLNKKVNINHADQEGFTALHFAAQNGDEIITRLLLNHGANTKLKDKTNNATPLMVAIENSHPNVARLLQEHETK